MPCCGVSTVLHNNCLIDKARLILYGDSAVRTRQFSITVPEDLANWLEREAVRQGRTRSNLIKWILEQYRRKSKDVENEESNPSEL